MGVSMTLRILTLLVILNGLACEPMRGEVIVGPEQTSDTRQGPTESASEPSGTESDTTDTAPVESDTIETETDTGVKIFADPSGRSIVSHPKSGYENVVKVFSRKGGKGQQQQG